MVEQSKNSPNRSYYTAALLAILLLGLALRLVQYFACRSFWLDEAGLALNFTNGLPTVWWRPFPNHQSAPALFNLLSGVIVQMAGLSEWSLRFFPLVAGAASLFFFWRFSRLWLRGAALLFATYTFAISSTLVFYSNEFKPYIFDVLFGMLILWGTVFCWRADLPRRSLWWLALMGAVAVWFSFPVVFVMAGAGGTVLLWCWRERRFSDLACFATVCLVWGASFSLQYFVSGRVVSQLTDLTGYWRSEGAFMPFPPWAHGGSTWFTGAFFGYFEEVAGLHHSRNIFQFLFLCGIVGFYRGGKRLELLALVAPALLTMLLSALEFYPFQGRLLLFTVPAALVICGEGIEVLLTRLRHPALCAVLVGIALFSPSAYSVPQLWRPVKLEEVREIAKRVKGEARPDEVILVFRGNPTFQYYQQRLGIAGKTVAFENRGVVALVRGELANGHRCWLVISHVKESEQAAVLEWFKEFSLRPVQEEVGAGLFLIEPVR